MSFLANASKVAMCMWCGGDIGLSGGMWFHPYVDRADGGNLLCLNTKYYDLGKLTVSHGSIKAEPLLDTIRTKF